jgi:predicted ATPase
LFACDLTKPVKQQEAVSIQRGVTRPLLRVQQALKATALVRLDASRLAAATYSDQIEPKMECDGGGLATVLAYLALNKPDAFKRLQDHLHAVIPAVQGVRFERRPVKRGEAQPAIMGDSLILDFDGAPGVPADMVSQGTLLVLGILTIILGPETPRLLLFDDIEHGLHPKAQRDLLELLRKLLEGQPDLQIIATSHSPYLVDALDPKQVRITYAAEGVSYCARLTDYPDFDHWKDEMSPGEFWSAVGENWAKDVPTHGAT